MSQAKRKQKQKAKYEIVVTRWDGSVVSNVTVALWLGTKVYQGNTLQDGPAVLRPLTARERGGR